MYIYSVGDIVSVYGRKGVVFMCTECECTVLFNHNIDSGGLEIYDRDTTDIDLVIPSSQYKFVLDDNVLYIEMHNNRVAYRENVVNLFDFSSMSIHLLIDWVDQLNALPVQYGEHYWYIELEDERMKVKSTNNFYDGDDFRRILMKNIFATEQEAKDHIKTLISNMSKEV